MPALDQSIVPGLYAGFHSPIAALDCGKKCAPYNLNRVPFCCDTRQVVPTVDEVEWEYLSSHTDLWHAWEAASKEETARLASQAPPGHRLIECLGHTRCQREFRAITCRAFPFYPYIDREGNFLGLSYYWNYAEVCWVVSHLDSVSAAYRNEFITTFDKLFDLDPQEKEAFRFHSSVTRRIFGRKHRAIPLLHRNGHAYKVTPSDGRMRRVNAAAFPKYGPYMVASSLPFPGEAE